MKEILNKKSFIIVSVIILILLICIFVMKITSNNNHGYLLLDDYIIEYSNDGINSASVDDIKNYKFRMIYDNSYLGNYVFDHVDETSNRLMFKNDDGINALKTPLLGLDTNTDLIDIKVEKMNEEDFNKYINLSEETINYRLSDLSYANKTIIGDITIYSIKYEGESEEDDCSMIFASVGNNNFIIDKDYSNHDGIGYVLYTFDVMYVVDLNKDNKYELIVAKNHYDVTDYSIYELDGNLSELFYTGK